jgi:hypothetical protein
VIIEMKEKDFCNSLRVSVLTIYVYYIQDFKILKPIRIICFHSIIINLIQQISALISREIKLPSNNNCLKLLNNTVLKYSQYRLNCDFTKTKAQLLNPTLYLNRSYLNVTP